MVVSETPTVRDNRAFCSTESLVMTKTLLLALILAMPARGPQTALRAHYQTSLAPALEANAVGAVAVRCGLRSEQWYLAVQTAAIRGAEKAAEGVWGGTDTRLSTAAGRHFDQTLATMAATEQAERNAPPTVCMLLRRSALLSTLDSVAMTMDADARKGEPVDGLILRTARRAAWGDGHLPAWHRPVWSRPRAHEG